MPISLLRTAVRFLRDREMRKIGVGFIKPSSKILVNLLIGQGLGLAAVVCLSSRKGSLTKFAGFKMLTVAEGLEELDAVILLEHQHFPDAMRLAEPLMCNEMVVLPFDASVVVSKQALNHTALEAAWNTSPDANYVARTGLTGHYVEFGTFWGRSFFPAYFRLRHWLNGNFFAFDSFAGLSRPLSDETTFTAGDFKERAYCCNVQSFKAIGAYVGMPEDRLVVVPGYYRDTLAGHSGEEYGLTPQSISVCVIDCDLKEPTGQVLDFIYPLLEPGALLYFDDWRLCRASTVVGERAAAIEWLRRHPEIELVEFDREQWQHQWFIFQKR